MNLIFHDLIGKIVEIYIDDVVVKSSAEHQHLADLYKVFKKARAYGLKMNPNKCAFGVSAGKFLEFMVHERGIEVNPDRGKAIKEVGPPTSEVKLEELIGKVNFLRRFISNLSGRIRSFTPLLRLKEGEEFAWGADQQKALDDIKEYLSNPPVLIAPQPGKSFKMYISAEDDTIGAVLAQEIDSKEHVSFYLSQKLIDTETRYCWRQILAPRMDG